MKSRSLTNDILKNLSNEAFSFGNLLVREYTPDVVEHLLRFHYTRLLSLKDDGDIAAIVVYADLTQAIASLPYEQRVVVFRRIAGHTLGQITESMGLNAGKAAAQAYRDISDFLNTARSDAGEPS